MTASSHPVTPESERLAQLRELVVLDSAPEPLFDSIARLASEVCGAPIALLSLIDEERQWFKANVGLPGVNETPRDVAFCAHAIQGDALFEVPDATQDARFDANPLVTGAPDIRFYAGAPLVLDGGARVGTLCVIDRESRRLDARQANMLKSLADIACQALVMRRDLIDRSLSVRSEYELALAQSEAFLHRTGRVAGVGGWEVDLVGNSITWSDETRRIHGVAPDYVPTLDAALDFYPPEARPAIERAVQAGMAGGDPWDMELAFITATGERKCVRTVGEVQFQQGKAVRLIGAFQDITERAAEQQALRERTAILDNTTDFVVQTDCDGFVTYMNAACRRAAGLAADADLRTCRYADFNTPETNQRFVDCILPAVKAEGVWLGETTVRLAGRDAVSVSHLVLAHRDASGRIERFSAVMRDITAELQAKREIERQSATLISVTEAIPASVSIVDTESRYQFVNSAFESWCGLPRSQIVGRPIRDVLGQEELDRRWPWVEKAFAGQSVTFEQSYPDRKSERHLQINYIPLRLADGSADGFVVVANDITRHKDEEGRLLDLAQRDPLTGLMNRAGFEQALVQRTRAGADDHLALLYIDLDHFKPVNDRHGHPVGDQVLKLFAARLRGSVRPTDVVARLGGDEFAVVLSGMRSAPDVQRVADKAIEAASTPFRLGHLEIVIGASVGIAHGAGSGDWRDLVERADAMLYRAKEEGRGRHAGTSEFGAQEFIALARDCN